MLTAVVVVGGGTIEFRCSLARVSANYNELIGMNHRKKKILLRFELTSGGATSPPFGRSAI
jgi:hypothetical protein